VAEPAVEGLVAESYYLGVPEAGDVQVDKIKRGPDKGQWMVLEVVSPVIFYERSLLDPEGRTLRSGRLWAELQVSGDVQRRVQKAPVFERTFRKVVEVLTRRARRSQPPGFQMLPAACKLHDQGYELREAGRKGQEVVPR
jgi:hypothetical protein